MEAGKGEGERNGGEGDTFLLMGRRQKRHREFSNGLDAPSAQVEQVFCYLLDSRCGVTVGRPIVCKEGARVGGGGRRGRRLK